MKKFLGIDIGTTSLKAAVFDETGKRLGFRVVDYTLSTDPKTGYIEFDAESYKTEIPTGASWIGQGYSTDATQVIVGDEEAGVPARDDVGFALPKEGFSIAFDEMVVAKNARRKDLAYAFINYIYDGEVAKVNMEYICGPNPVKPGIEALDPEYRSIIIPDDATISRGQLLRGFADNPEVMELYNKAWDKIKATEAR